MAFRKVITLGVCKDFGTLGRVSSTSLAGRGAYGTALSGGGVKDLNALVIWKEGIRSELLAPVLAATEALLLAGKGMDGIPFLRTRRSGGMPG